LTLDEMSGFNHVNLKKGMRILTLTFLLNCTVAFAQNYDTNGDYVQTFAGSGLSGYVNGVGVNTMFNNPSFMVADSKSNLFVWDSGNFIIRKISPDATVTSIATNFNLSINYLGGMTIDRNDNIWTASDGQPNSMNSAITLSEITGNTIVTNIPLPIYSAGLVGICADSLGNIYIACGNTFVPNKIYQYNTNGVLSVFAGSGNQGHVDGNGIFTSFNTPTALACDQANNIYVWDSGSYFIRKIDQSQNVTTIAGNGFGISQQYQVDGVGTNAGFYGIYQMCVDDSGILILACGLSVRKMNAQTKVVTMAGTFTQGGYVNGFTNVARFGGAYGVCLSQGMVFVTDAGNERIRQISSNPLPQVVSGANLGIGTFAGVTITGIVGRTYQIQSSPDLSTWTTVATVLLTSSPYLWIDQNPIAGNKFYQAMLLP